MKRKIEKALGIAKQLVTAYADLYGCKDFRSRIITLENEDEEPYAEILLVFKGTKAVEIQIQYNGTTYSKQLDNEEQIIDEIEMAIANFERVGMNNLIWLGQ